MQETSTTTVTNDSILISHGYLPADVKYIIDNGCNNFIGFVNDQTVLKYPNLPAISCPLPDSEDEDTKIRSCLRMSQEHGLAVEEQILRRLGQHPRIIDFKGKHAEGLLLEYMPLGYLSSYLKKGSTISYKQKLKWAIQIAEAIDYIHSKDVLHCNIHTNNVLVDTNLNIKLCDFQGKILNPDGTVSCDGESCENAKSSMPRSDSNVSNRNTDIFALASVIYFMMKGHEPFPDLDTIEDELEISRRFESKQFPALGEILGGRIVHNC